MPAVVGHCLTVEKLGVPTVPVVTVCFQELVKTIAYKKAMPNQRFVFVPHPISGRTALECRKYLECNDPIAGKPIVEEIVSGLTKPLTHEEKKTGFIERSASRLVEPNTAENLQGLFVENGLTDGLPIVLPTEDKVADMLKGTSHRPDETVATMRPSPPHEAWEYTVEKVAVNAVMAGAKPQYFPVILAIAATGVTSLFTSTSSFARMVVTNGPIRKQIGMNSGIGALGPFNEANAIIGRAWTLISKNLGGGGVPRQTYLGTQGNNLNYNNVCFSEKEEALPSGWEPLHVQKGFNPGESVVSIFSGWSILNYGAFKPYPIHEVIKRQLVSLEMSGTGGHGPRANVGIDVTLLLDPLVARDLREKEGFDTKEKFSQWLVENTHMSMWNYKAISMGMPDALKAAQGEIEPPGSLSRHLSEAESPLPLLMPGNPVEIIVVGGETNPFWQVGDFRYVASASVDKWK